MTEKEDLERLYIKTRRWIVLHRDLAIGLVILFIGALLVYTFVIPPLAEYGKQRELDREKQIEYINTLTCEQIKYFYEHGMGITRTEDTHAVNVYREKCIGFPPMD